MLLAEYDYDTDIAVQRQESLMLGIQQGIERGIERGIEQGIKRGRSAGFADGIEQGRSEGAYQKAIETAAAFKRLGIDIDKIAEGAGLSREEIKKL